MGVFRIQSPPGGSGALKLRASTSIARLQLSNSFPIQDQFASRKPVIHCEKTILTAWVETKRHKLGRSLRTIQYLLKGKTEASKERQLLLAQRHASLRSVTELILDSPIEIATEMSQLVLKMRESHRGDKKELAETQTSCRALLAGRR